MTDQVSGRFFLAFGRVIESDIDLPLLAEIKSSEILRVEAQIVVDNNPIPVPPALISRNPAQSITFHRGPSQVVVVMHQLGWLARLWSASTTITLHPIARGVTSRGGAIRTANRVLSDRVVTNLLPYLPQLWGLWGIHGALLDTPGGGVMLLGPSWSGKSTLSQVLARDHGWWILDDDTSMVTEIEPPCSFAPMGAKARLREDAAMYLGIDIDSLESYSGRKGILSNEVQPRPHASQGVQAFVTVKPVDAPVRTISARTRPECTALSGLEAMHSIFESFFSIESDLRTVIQRQLSLSAKLSRIPHVSVRYSRGLHTPEQTAQEIASAIGPFLEVK